MPRILFVFLLSFPIIELVLIIHVGKIIGALATIFLLVLSAIIGVALVRHAGIRTFVAVRQRVSQGEPPGQELLDGALLLLVGVLFLLPGFTTDILALLLIFPGSRFLFRWGIMAMLARIAKAGLHATVVVPPDVVEGEFCRENHEPGSSQMEAILKLPEKHE